MGARGTRRQPIAAGARADAKMAAAMPSRADAEERALPDRGVMPRISVIIAVRNGAATVRSAIDSVREQTYPHLELLVVDGASTDGTQAILESYGDGIAWWISEPDTGVFNAWNKALDHVTGDWVCFLGADDRYRDANVMATMAAAMVADGGEHRVLYAGIDRHLVDGRLNERHDREWTRRRRRRFRQGIMIPHPATFHHVSVFEEHGQFDEGFRIAGDYEFLLRELLDNPPLHVPEVIVDMQGGGLSNQPSTRSRMFREIYRARYMHGIAKRPPWASPRLMRDLAQIWIDINVRPRVEQIRARAARTPRES